MPGEAPVDDFVALQVEKLVIANKNIVKVYTRDTTNVGGLSTPWHDYHACHSSPTLALTT